MYLILLPIEDYTVKPAKIGHSKICAKVLKTNWRQIQVESIAECSLGAFCNTFDLYYAMSFFEWPLKTGFTLYN